MIILTIITSLLWPYYQLSEISLAESYRFYALDLLYLVSFIILVPKLLKKESSLLKSILIFVVIAGISLLVSKLNSPNLTWNQILLSSLYLFRFILYLPLLLIPAKTKPYFVLSLLIFPIVGLLQYIAIPDLRFLKAFNFDDHLYRLTFPFLDPNLTGAVLGFIIFYLLGKRQLLLNRVFIFLTLIALVLTFSRSSYISFGVSALYLCLMANRSKIRTLPIMVISCLFIFILIITPKPFGEGVNLLRTYSITSRLSDISDGLSQFERSPLLGLGFNTLKFQSEVDSNSRASGGISNSLVFILATMGIAGLISFGFILVNVYRVIRKDVFLTAAFLVLLTNSLFNNTLFYSPILVLIFLALSYEISESR